MCRVGAFSQTALTRIAHPSSKIDFLLVASAEKPAASVTVLQHVRQIVASIYMGHKLYATYPNDLSAADAVAHQYGLLSVDHTLVI